jgi:xanthine dehydrogenase molybdopterin-binding subunit B
MKFDSPATTNPIDQLKVIGRPTNRIDGPFKTTGTARYAYERHDVAPHQAYGFVLGSAIAKGRINAIDVSQAKAAPGVLAIVTTLDMPRLAKGAMNVAFLFGGAEIQHYHQAVAIVVAETFEQARGLRLSSRSITRQNLANSISQKRPRMRRCSAETAERAAVRRQSTGSANLRKRSWPHP